MAGLDQLKLTFFEECVEALQQIEAGLTEIGEGQSSEETVNAVFRAVHSVKGGAGIFGFEGLVEFAHVFETVLDALRRGSLGTTAAVVDVLLAASDVLSDLVQMSRAGEPIPPSFGSECRKRLEQLMQAGSAATDAKQGEEAAAPADFEDIEFVPVRAEDFDDPGAMDAQRRFTISFRPRAELLRKANEPLFIIRELRKLGELDLLADADGLPSLAEIEADHPYIGWTATLLTTATRDQVEDVFEFVVGDCDLEIVEIVDDASAAGSETGDDTSSDGSTAALAAAGSSNVEAATPERVSGEPAAPTGERRPPQAKPTATTTRIELERIDRVVNMVGELVIAQAMLGQIVQDLPEGTNVRLSQILDEVTHHTRELKDSVMSMRAQPVGAVFQRMPRLVRELASKTTKKIRLEMSGETTEVDRSIIERLADPLTHIIRNSADHGIEQPAERVAAGKSDEGTIRLAAEHRGGRIVIEISDDGAGINSERVLRKAKEKGLVGADVVLNEDEMNNLIFLPGFSTAESVSDISGRGVGMDVVRRNIQDIGGRISIKSVRGKGMTIQLALPLTLAVMDGMVIRIGVETFVLPLSAIMECLRPARDEVSNLIGTSGMLQLRGDLVPLVHLGELLNICTSASESNDSVVIITDGGEGTRFGLIVDELLGHQQVVIKSIEESYGPVPGIAAATILGNGRVALILDIEKLSELAVSVSANAAASAGAGIALEMTVAA